MSGDHHPMRIPVSQNLRGVVGLLVLALTVSGCGGGGGGGGSRPATTLPANQLPTARISASTIDGFAELSVDFDGSPSSDPDGQITTWAWNFGDGSPPVQGVQVSHTFSEPGGYNVQLTVTDDDGATDTEIQHVRVRGVRLSGSVQILSTSAVDSDVNDRLTVATPNNDRFTAQAVGNPLRLGGFVNLPGTGPDDGNLFDSGDAADFFAIQLTGEELIVLNIADTAADLDLRLWDSAGTLIDASLGSGSTESLSVPAAGDYFIEVFPHDGPTNIAGASNYVLSVGQDLSVNRTQPTRLTDPFVADQMLIAAAQASAPGRLEHRYDLRERGRSGRHMLAELGPETLTRARARLALAARVPDAGLSEEGQARYRTLLALKALVRDPAVAAAELNVLLEATLTPDDDLYALQWHLPAINAPAAWDLSTGASTGLQDVIVAVVDTGILPQHPEFAGQLVAGYDFIADAGRARDFNGIDDDPTDAGDLAYGGSSSFHGTHVAGTVAARTDNGQGVAGVSWQARIMPLRALGVDGGTTYDVMQAVRYAAGLVNDSGRLPAQPADIINLSLGSPFFSQSAQDTFNEVRNRGILIVASAGNESTSAPSYPAAYQGVVSVSATTIEDTLAPYSNFGSTIDVAAPGGYNATDLNGDGFSDGVVSTLGDDSNPGSVLLGYGALSGTSMAAPHVAGVAALMKAVHPGLTPGEFDSALLAGELTTDLGAPGRDDSFGWGLIDAQKAVLAALSLASGGGMDPGPVLGASDTSVDLGVLATSRTVRIENLGSGSLTIDRIELSEPWLTAVPVNVDANGLGDYTLNVDRTGLAEGAWSATARFVPEDPNTNSATITVTLQVAGNNPAADAGLLYVVAVDEAGDTQGNAAVVAVDNGSYQWVLNDLPPGSYRIFAGSDMDNDNFLCDAGESCGAYRTLDAQERLTLDPQTAPVVDDIDFVAEFRAVITTQTGASEVTGGVDADHAIRLERAAPAPRPPPVRPGSTTEQR